MSSGCSGSLHCLSGLLIVLRAVLRWQMLIPQKSVGNLAYTPPWWLWGSLPFLCWGGVREGQVDSQNFYYCSVGTRQEKSYQKQRRASYNGGKFSLPRRHSSSTCIHTKQQSCQLREAKLRKPKGETDKSTVTVWDFTAPLLTIKQEISGIEKNSVSLSNIYRKLRTITAEYTIFSKAFGIYTKMDHIQGSWKKPQ